jgi:hypothetical protein
MGLLPSPLPLISLPPVAFRPSPNQSQRTHGNGRVDLIVCHTPQGSYASGIATCLNPTAQVSYHVLISEDGKHSTQFVQWDRKAWHALVHNSRSEGISLAGFAADTKALSPGGRVMARVVAARLKARGLPPTWRRTGGTGGGFCRHADLQADRTDPMPLTRWLTFVALVKYEHARGQFRERWGYGEPDEISPAV